MLLLATGGALLIPQLGFASSGGAGLGSGGGTLGAVDDRKRAIDTPDRAKPANNAPKSPWQG